MKNNKKNRRYELRMLSLLAAILAITSIGQFSLHGMEVFGTTLIPMAVMRIILVILFWVAFIFLFVALNMFRKL